MLRMSTLETVAASGAPAGTSPDHSPATTPGGARVARDVPVPAGFDMRRHLSGIGSRMAGPANVILQLSWPGVGYGVMNSRVHDGSAMLHPIKRARTTFTYLAVSMLGTDEDRTAFRKAVNGQHARARRQLGHLVLVPGVEADGFAVTLVLHPADRPAAGVFLDLAAKGLRDDLVAEADPDQRAPLRMDGADQVFQRRDPVMFFVGAIPRAGDEPAVGGLGSGGELAVHHAIGVEVEAPATQQGFEHAVVIAELAQEILGRMSGLQDTDFHESRLGYDQIQDYPSPAGRARGSEMVRPPPDS